MSLASPPISDRKPFSVLAVTGSCLLPHLASHDIGQWSMGQLQFEGSVGSLMSLVTMPSSFVSILTWSPTLMP
ncbi:MAG: hypothetical protein K0S45_1910 [Nitrospira sp.]|nr:hypothetical protein [Nitrospira sp.]